MYETACERYNLMLLPSAVGKPKSTTVLTVSDLSQKKARQVPET
jgi:hypothetical protein